MIVRVELVALVVPVVPVVLVALVVPVGLVILVELVVLVVLIVFDYLSLFLRFNACLLVVYYVLLVFTCFTGFY